MCLVHYALALIDTQKAHEHELSYKTQISRFTIVSFPTTPNNDTMTAIDKPIDTENYVKYYNSEDESNCYDPPKRSRRNRPRKKKMKLRNEQEPPLLGSKDETCDGLDGSLHPKRSRRTCLLAARWTYGKSKSICTAAKIKRMVDWMGAQIHLTPPRASNRRHSKHLETLKEMFASKVCTKAIGGSIIMNQRKVSHPRWALPKLPLKICSSWQRFRVLLCFTTFGRVNIRLKILLQKRWRNSLLVY